MPSFDFSLEGLAKMGIISFIGSVLVGVTYLLAQKDVLGVRMKSVGDRGWRVVFGHPVWPGRFPGSHFFIKTVFDYYIVNVMPHVHNQFVWTYGLGQNKMFLTVCVESRVMDTVRDWKKAIFSLGDYERCRESDNKRTQRVELLIREQLTVAMEGAAGVWSAVRTQEVMERCNAVLAQNGTEITVIRLVEPNASDGALVAGAVNEAVSALGR